MEKQTNQSVSTIKFSQTAQEIRQECEALCAMLTAKNESYGDSALSPKRIFSRADPVEQIKVRLDDKISRMANSKGEDAWGEDVVMDLLGYLILLRIATKRRSIEQARIYQEEDQASMKRS